MYGNVLQFRRYLRLSWCIAKQLNTKSNSFKFGFLHTYSSILHHYSPKYPVNGCLMATINISHWRLLPPTGLCAPSKKKNTSMGHKRGVGVWLILPFSTAVRRGVISLFVAIYLQMGRESNNQHRATMRAAAGDVDDLDDVTATLDSDKSPIGRRRPTTTKKQQHQHFAFVSLPGRAVQQHWQATGSVYRPVASESKMSYRPGGYTDYVGLLTAGCCIHYRPSISCVLLCVMEYCVFPVCGQVGEVVGYSVYY